MFNSLSADFPKFVDLEYEVKNKRKSAVKVNASVVLCNDPKTSSKYSQEFTIAGETTETIKVKVLNCGTAAKPQSAKPFVSERVRID